MSPEDTSDTDIGRLNRMVWTACEARQGIAWARDWPTSGNLFAAKVSVRPTARTPDETTLLVTYKEGAVTRCTATMHVLNDSRIVKELSMTASGAEVPGSKKLGGLEVSDKLKEIHLAGS